MAARRVELAAAAAGAAAGLVSGVLHGGIVPTVACVVLGGSLGLVWRWPVAAWLIAVAALLATVPYGELSLPADLLVAAHAGAAGHWLRRRLGLLAGITLVAAGELGVLVGHGSAVPPILLSGAAWAGGRALRERDVIAARLALQARELEEERDAYAQLSVRYERARVASELHDIVAHALSVMVVQASAGQRLAAVDPELTAEAFEAIAGAAHQAEEDIGRLVELLADADAVDRAPDVTLVQELVARACGSGLRVRLRLEGERESLAPAVGQAAYRVVQEGLTNALRHASGAAVEVLVRGAPDTLLVDVHNERPPAGGALLADAGTGTGLIGLRDRVAAAGGRLDAGPTADGGWRLSANMPRHPPTGAPGLA
jgi:signal transduction histidine kinase